MQTIHDDSALLPSMAAEGRDTGSRAADIWKDETGKVRIAVWKAEPGHYGVAGRPYSETFIVTQGTASVIIGAGEPRDIGPGSIVHIPEGASVAFDVQSDFAKFTTAVSR